MTEIIWLEVLWQLQGKLIYYCDTSCCGLELIPLHVTQGPQQDHNIPQSKLLVLKALPHPQLSVLQQMQPPPGMWYLPYDVLLNT